jgi:predicted flap endonuclease-1-like 5' DNA nuclease
MSIFIGAVCGILICWFAQKTLGLGLKVHQAPVPAVVTAGAIEETAEMVRPALEEKRRESPETSVGPKQQVSAKPKKAAVRASRGTQTEKDDLKKIGGIGPKIAEILNNDGVISFRQLSKKKPSELKSILDKAGGRYRASDLSTWSKQAEYAAKGDWQSAKEVWERSK